MGINDRTGGAACYPYNTEARRRWQLERDIQHRRAPHPAPEVAARAALEAEIPGGAKRIIKAALERDWQVRATYSRGTQLQASGRAGRVVDTVLVIGWRQNDRLPAGVAPRWWASWVDASFEQAYSPQGHRVNATELRRLLDQPPLSWGQR